MLFIVHPPLYISAKAIAEPLFSQYLVALPPTLFSYHTLLFLYIFLYSLGDWKDHLDIRIGQILLVIAKIFDTYETGIATDSTKQQVIPRNADGSLAVLLQQMLNKNILELLSI